MSGEIFFQISFRVVKGHSVVLQQRMDFEPRLQTEETPHLPLGQGACPVTLHGNGFQGMAGHVSPLPFEGLGDVFRQVPPAAAARIEEAHVRSEPTLEDLVEQIDVDVAKLLAQVHP